MGGRWKRRRQQDSGGDWTKEILDRFEKYLKAYMNIFTGEKAQAMRHDDDDLRNE